MNSRVRKQTLTVVAVLAVVCMLVSQLLVFPQRTANAAGTDLYVGYPGQSNNFSTVQDAVNRAASLNPSSESNRVTIHIAPGTYRQQVVVQTPYITFVNDDPSKGNVVLTWYYGIGYKYYSANSKGYYDASLAASKSGKNVANYRWGATVQLWPKATNFKAKNIVFENSFNRYITNEELADGVECTNETLTVQRNQGVDVKSKAYTERAAALSADTSYCEFLNCQFLSSQDTLYTGGSPQYYKNCIIEGQTDYIFGGSNAVFDSCELRWKGYSSGSTGGYITAARSQGDPYTGYLFMNCNVTANSQLTVTPGYLGRPWAQTAKVLFVNTTLQNANLIRAEGWYSMSGVQPETVDGFKENGTKLTNGTRVDLSQRKGHTVSDNDAKNINITSYMNNWTPSYLNGSSGQQEQPQGGNNVSDAIKLCGGWFEEAFVEWDSSKLGNNIKVGYALSGSGSFTAVDSQLIRNNRVDIPGLKGNTKYDIKVEGSSGSASCTITTMAFDRSGYAHYNYTGVGAYNDDGTLKSGASVIYVTNSNKDSVTFGGQTGLYNIFNKAEPSNVTFRLIGTIDVPSGAKANDGKQNDGSNMLYLNGGKNVTIEGIGYDANLNQWGFDMKHSTSCEVRNLHLAKYPDDGISMSGGSTSKSSHMWVHNNTIEKGYNAYAGNGIVDDDKSDGDGSTDIKWTDYATISYNVYIDCHKTSLVGGGTTHEQDWITYHHNWFNNTESRNPRARRAHVHIYNNYFSTNKQYGIGASYNSKVFSESNYYEKTNLPLDAVNMGSDEFSGTIKSFNDKFDNCTMGSGLAYKIVYSRNEAAQINNLKSGGEGYDNFDLNMYSYTAQTPDQAKATVKELAGRMQQKAYNAGTVTQGQQGEIVTPDNDIKSTLISKLDPKDPSYGFLWSISENVKQGDKAFADREHVIASLPSDILGGEHILTACDSKKTDSDLAVITAAKDIIVYVAFDQRVTSLPSWIASYSKQGQVVEINDSEEVRPFDVYSKEVKSGESITLGTNGMSGACMNYTVFVKEKPAETTTTTTETTTTITTTTTTEETTTTTTTTTTEETTTTTTTTVTEVSATLWGDANLDQKVTIADAVAILQHIGNKDKYGLKQQGLINSDVYGHGDGLTAMDAYTIQKVDAGVLTESDLPVD